MTIHGLGGRGKSALAIEFAYHAMSKGSRLVFWVLAITQESFELAYKEIGIRLHIPGIDKENADIKRLVHDYLTSEHAGRWLMIVDNVDDQNVLLGTTDSSSKSIRLIDYLPRSDNGAILFTTRSRKAAIAITQSNVLELTDLGKSEARLLLSHRLTGIASSVNEANAVDELLEMLAYLPLAIVQAAAFMSNNDVSVSCYINLFKEAGAELFHEQFDDPGRYRELDNTIAKTWYISFDQIRKHEPLAAHFLSFIACIDRVNIPQSLIAGNSLVVPRTKALGTLTGYAFLTEQRQTQETAKDRVFDMHRLVHMASIWWLERHGARTTWVDTAAATLKDKLPHSDYENIQAWSLYLPHAIRVAESPSLAGTTASAFLLNRVGRCQASLGQHSAAEITCRKALVITKKLFGPEHPETLVSMHELGEAIYNLGKYAEAERMQLETLELRKKVLGDECLGTLRSMNNLAAALCNQGKYVEAEKLHREVLSLKQKVLPAEHPSTLKSISNVAEVLSSQGKYAEAEEAHREVLRLRMKIYGEKHSDTLNSMSNLAGALSAQGNYSEAEKIGRKTLKLRLELLGDKHPNTLLSMSNLAFVFAQQLHYDEARCMYEQACSGYKTALGENHPWTHTCHQLYQDLLASQKQALILAKKKVQAEGGNSLGDKIEASIPVPFVEPLAFGLPFTPARNDSDSRHLSAVSAKQPVWKKHSLLRSAKSGGFRRAASLLRYEKSLPDSQG